MSPIRLDHWWSLFCAAFLLGTTACAATPQRTLVMDPVELVHGHEVAGSPDLSIMHEGIEYRFSSAENRALFQQDPGRFEVADGGACGRMGPLSGLGDERRYAVHACRIYFFASDACREGFLSDPASHIEGEDPMPFGIHDQVLRGRETLDRLLAWMGGGDRLRGITSFRAWAERTETHNETDWRIQDETVVVFPRGYFQKLAWNESWYSTATGAEGGVMSSSTQGPERIAESRARAFERAMARWAIVIAKAHADGSPEADCPGLVVIGDGEGVAGDTPVEFVKVWLNDAASRLCVEKGSGRLHSVAFHGRDGSMRVGEVVRTFTEYKTEGGLTLPSAYTVTLNGKELPRAASRIDGFELNIRPASELFRVPPWPGERAP
jgi:YHS domain-containing protein